MYIPIRCTHEGLNVRFNDNSITNIKNSSYILLHGNPQRSSTLLDQEILRIVENVKVCMSKQGRSTNVTIFHTIVCQYVYVNEGEESCCRHNFTDQWHLLCIHQSTLTPTGTRQHEHHVASYRIIASSSSATEAAATVHSIRLHLCEVRMYTIFTKTSFYGYMKHLGLVKVREGITRLTRKST